MKRSAIVAAAAISMTGAASAHLLSPPSHTATPQPSPREKLSTVTAPVVGHSTNPVNQPTSPEVPRKASVDVRQPPVPLRVAPRIPVALPTADTSEAYAKGEAGVPTTSKSKPTDNKSGESAARAAIEADGYKGVEVLHKGDNDLWHAKALRGGTEILLTVDSKGTVTTAN
jgi:hypothetical protein